MDNTSRQTNFQSGEFRQVLGTFATGVTVVTAMSSKGELAGLTANSFTSVSLDPPLILWCLANSSDNLGIFQTARYFAVNILAADQKDISTHFAKKQKHKFESVQYQSGRGGVPLLDGCVSWLQCRTITQYVVGDHHVFIGEVEQIDASGKEALLYHQGDYAMSLPLPDTDTPQTVTSRQYRSIEVDLYTLLVQAIQVYQEQFESKQLQLAGNKYEARLLMLLYEPGKHGIEDLSSKIQIPKSETESILADLATNGLIKSRSFEGGVELTASGREKARLLWNLAKQHETDALALLSKGQEDAFRDNLLRLIKWRHD